MAQFKPVPAYVVEGTTPADMAAAEVEYARLQQNPAHSMVGGPRRAAVAAKFASAMPLTPIEAVEFAAIVPEGYRVAPVDTSYTSAALEAAAARHAWQESERLRIAAENAKPHRNFATAREAQQALSPGDYMQWCSDHQDIVARMSF